MNVKSRSFKIVDILYLATAILPFVCGILLKILTTPQSDGIAISGAQIFCSVKMPLQDMLITESQVNSWLVMISLFGLCLYLTHGLNAEHPLKRQLAAEWIVENVDKLVRDNMGEYFIGFAPFIAAILGLSAFSSFSSLTGMYPPTSDINVTAGWAILVFILITYFKCKCGPIQYIKGFGDPVPFLAPLNIIGEVATPISMAFRHYGNVLSGSVISVLIAAALQKLSALLLGWLPGVLGEIPFLRIGLPAVLSVYFDVFSGGLQAYIFAMLTMLYVSGGFPQAEYERRKAKKEAKKQMKNKK